MYKNDIEGKYNYTQKDTFMGFHCGNTASSKLSFCEMKYQMIMARTLPEEVTQGTLEGDIMPGDITFYRLQSTADNASSRLCCTGRSSSGSDKIIRCNRSIRNSGDGKILPSRTDRKGNYPHHGAVAFGQLGKALFEVFKYIGVPVDEIGYNQPAGCQISNRESMGIITDR